MRLGTGPERRKNGNELRKRCRKVFLGVSGVARGRVVLLFLNQLYFVSIYLEEGTQ